MKIPHVGGSEVRFPPGFSKPLVCRVGHAGQRLLCPMCGEHKPAITLNGSPLKLVDEFEYLDPIDGSRSPNQGWQPSQTFHTKSGFCWYFLSSQGPTTRSSLVVSWIWGASGRASVGLSNRHVHTICRVISGSYLGSFWRTKAHL